MRRVAFLIRSACAVVKNVYELKRGNKIRIGRYVTLWKS